MPEIHMAGATAAAAQSVSLFFDDEDFGEFAFAPNSHPLPNVEDARPAAPASCDEDWGEFVSSPMAPSQVSPAWGKSRGPLPLSFFGADDTEVEEESAEEGSGAVATSLSPFDFGVLPGTMSSRSGDLKDVIAGLYGSDPLREDKSVPVQNGNGMEDDGINRCALNGSDLNDLHFKASSDPVTGDIRKDQTNQNSRHENAHALDFWSPFCNANNGVNDEAWIFKDAASISDSALETAVHTHENNGSNFGGQAGNGASHRSDDEGWEFKGGSNRYIEITSWEQNVSDAPLGIFTSTNEKPPDWTAIWKDNLNDSYHNYPEKGSDVGLSCEEKTTTENGTKVYPRSPSISSLLDLYKVGDVSVPVHGRKNLLESNPSPSHSIMNGEQSSLTDQDHSCVSVVGEKIVDFYTTLRDATLRLIASHLNVLREERKVSHLPGQDEKTDIQEARAKLESMDLDYLFMVDKYCREDGNVIDLLESFKEHLKYFDGEYDLSQKLLLASKDMKSALELCQHCCSTLHVLELASSEERHAYSVTWSKILSVCADELQHGATVWGEAERTGVSMHMIALGGHYFLALAEIYRLAVITKISTRRFQPWVLSSCGDEVSQSSDRCAVAWESALCAALERVSKEVKDHALAATELAASIETLDGLNHLSFQDLSFRIVEEEGMWPCQITLLPTSMLRDMKIGVWEGRQCLVKLANLWANRVSSDPPELPSLPAFR